MSRFIAAAASVGAVAISLSGCGESGATTLPPDAAPSPAPSGPSPSPVPNPSPAPAGPSAGSTTPAPSTTPVATTTPDTSGKTPIYLVMRMDDANPIDGAEVQTDILNWFADHNLKYNFGIIVGQTPGEEWGTAWPLTCAESPTDEYCDSSVVQFVQQAYDDGKVVGTGPNAIFEIGSHSYDHGSWGRKWNGFTPDSDWAEWQEHDMEQATSALRQLYPQASIKYFAAPTNMASADTLTSMKNHGLEILSAASTLQCSQWGLGVLTPPCGVQPDPNVEDITPSCQPEGDVWATTEGMARVQDIVSAPAGCANSNWAGGGQQGITVDETIGVNDCACNSESGKVWCSVVSSAKNNAAKSNGLHWAVLMMHPNSRFPGGQSYKEWLDEFYEKLQALEEYSVHFINFQDLLHLHAPGAAAGKVVTV